MSSKAVKLLVIKYIEA